VEMLVAVIVEKFEISEAQREVLQRRVAALSNVHAQNVLTESNSPPSPETADNNENHSPQSSLTINADTHSFSPVTSILEAKADPFDQEDRQRRSSYMDRKNKGIEDQSTEMTAQMISAIHDGANIEMGDETRTTVGKVKALDIFMNEQMEEYLLVQRNSLGSCILKRWFAEITEDKRAEAFFLMRIHYQLYLRGISQDEMFVQRSFWLFEFYNPVRAQCRKTVAHPAFEWIVFGVIIISCFFLTIDTPNKGRQLSNARDILDIADPVLVVIFALECLLKVVANGFIGKPTAYLSDSMNRFDFGILILSAVAIVFKDLDGLGGLFRAFRCMRPLRLVSKSQRLRVVLLSTLSVIPDTVNVILFFLFITFLFGTVALPLFMDGLLACNLTSVAGKTSCLGAFVGPDLFLKPLVWSLPDRNFQHIFVGIVSLLEVSSTELWTEVMFDTMDLMPKDEQPRQNADGGNAIFFVIYLLLARQVVFSLIIGIIIDQFNTASGKGMLTEKQRNFKVISQAIFTEPKPMYLQQVDRQEAPFRHLCTVLVGWQYWTSTVVVMVLLNGLVLMLPYHDMSSEYEDTLEALNHTLAGLFVLELIVRITAYGPQHFFRDPWNQCLPYWFSQVADH